MKRRISAAFLALALCLGLAVPAFAAEGKTVTTPDGKFQLTNVVDTAVVKAEGEDAKPMDGETVYLVKATGASLSLVDADEVTNIEYAQYEVHDGVLEQEDAVAGLWEEDSFAAHELSEERQKVDEAYFQDGVGDLHSVSILDSKTDKTLATILIAFVKEDYEPAPEETDKPDPDDKPAAPEFADVEEGAYYEDAVKWAVAHEPVITNGTSETTFEPETTCTQVQILTFLYRAAGEPEAKGELPVDIEGKNVDYAKNALCWAAEKKMIDETFDVEADCTRATAVSYIWQAFDKPEADKSEFKDVDAEADYAAAVDWAVANGITNGTDMEAGEFSPDDTCTRGQIVTFLHRAYVEEARLNAD